MKFGALVFGLLAVSSSIAHAQSEDNCAVGSEMQIRPVVATHTVPRYPKLSQRLYEQGTTILKVTIGPDGNPIEVSPYKSSGSLRLDAAAVAHVKGVWKWRPPFDAACNPVSVATLVSVVWSLKGAQHDAPRYTELDMSPSDYPKGALDRKEQGVVVLDFHLTTGGSIVNPIVLQSSGFPDLDAKAIEVLESGRRWKPTRTDGNLGQPEFGIVAVWLLPRFALGKW